MCPVSCEQMQSPLLKHYRWSKRILHPAWQLPWASRATSSGSHASRAIHLMAMPCPEGPLQGCNRRSASPAPGRPARHCRTGRDTSACPGALGATRAPTAATPAPGRHRHGSLRGPQGPKPQRDHPAIARPLDIAIAQGPHRHTDVLPTGHDGRWGCASPGVRSDKNPTLHASHPFSCATGALVRTFSLDGLARQGRRPARHTAPNPRIIPTIAPPTDATRKARREGACGMYYPRFILSPISKISNFSRG